MKMATENQKGKRNKWIWKTSKGKELHKQFFPEFCNYNKVKGLVAIQLVFANGYQDEIS